MMKQKLHTLLGKAILVAMPLLALVTTSCERKDLWLRQDQATIEIAIYDIRLDLLWGIEWQAQWQYSWDAEMYGDIGYTKPEYIRASIYELDQQNGMKRMSPYTKNFPVGGGRVTLKTDAWYDMLFYNAGTEYTLFQQSANYDYYDASTRTSDYSPVITRGSEETRDGIEVPKDYTSYKQPDELFGTFIQDLEVSSDPDLYDKYQDETTGEIIYLYNVKAEMMPYSYIYMLQVMVLNNTDSIGEIISLKRNTSTGDTIRYGATGMTLTGLAQGVELFSRKTFDRSCSVTIDESSIHPVKKTQLLTLPDGSKAMGDIFAARMLTWGLPGIVPMTEWEAVKAGTSATTYKDRNKLGIRFYLRNGYTHTEVFDVSEQMRKHPCGGIITVVIDARESVSDEELNQKTTSSGGGFNASVENWQNEVNADVTI